MKMSQTLAQNLFNNMKQKNYKKNMVVNSKNG